MPRSLPRDLASARREFEALVVGDLDRLVDDRRVVARVVLQRHRRLVREGRRRNEVLPAQLGRIDLQLGGGLADDALDHEGRLGTAGAAIGIDRRGVRQRRPDVGVDQRRRVLAGQQRRIEIGRHRRREGREIRAHVGDRVDLEREELAVLVERQLGMGDVVAAMRVGHERLAALRRPLDRPADAGHRPGHHRLFVVAEDLAAEAAAHVGRDHAQLVLGNAEHEGRQDEAQHMRVLRRRPERVVAGALVVVGRRGARLHGVGDQAVVDDVDLGDVRRLRERRIDIGLHADFPVVDQVARRFRMDLGHALVERLGEVDVGGHHLVVDLDRLGGVTRLVMAVGHDHGDRVADIAHRIERHHRMRRRLVRLAVLVLDHPAADQAADLGVGGILAGEDLDHARHRLGRRGVDALDLRMGMRRTQEVRVGRPRERQVIDIAAGSRQEALVFRPAEPARRFRWRRSWRYTPADFIAGAAARIAFTMLW